MASAPGNAARFPGIEGREIRCRFDGCWEKESSCVQKDRGSSAQARGGGVRPSAGPGYRAVIPFSASRQSIQVGEYVQNNHGRAFRDSGIG